MILRCIKKARMPTAQEAVAWGLVVAAVIEVIAELVRWLR
jgi:hypothetical protein